MTRQDFKRPGYLRAGFQYQDLVAIEILINFYRQRDLYSWVQLEAEDDSFRSIEDVVACRPDGLYELTQVKFTADPDAPANALSCEWLTENGGVKHPGQRGRVRRSLLQKWAETTLRHIGRGTLAQAVLKTDRIPDDTFASCLKDGRVSFELLPEEAKATIGHQLGSVENARTFFENFEFIHSQPILDDLAEQLWSRISSDTDRGGWAIFQQQVQRWSTRRREPGPDGKIRYIHLKQAFAVGRPKPLPQGFVVPADYRVPNHEFDAAFLKEVIGSDGLAVIWGPPGQGKSTYLSHCTERIDHKDAVCIRHHYFLSLEDRSEGRFSYSAIFRSLEHQLEGVIPTLRVSSQLPRGIGELVSQAAHLLRQEGRKLIIIVDGLDHVWREHRDHEDMEALFEALLPLPENVRLIVGTQKVASEHLPARLLNALPTERWTELPPMSQETVDHWLSRQDEAGRLNLRIGGGQKREEVFRSVSRAFHSISRGLPLHLIYSFEELVRTGHAVTEDDVKELPACPTGDIRDYYRSLWVRVGQKARTVLHVLAGLEFGPPPFAMQECFGTDNESLKALAEIIHLLDSGAMKVRPFHGSLFAFVRDQPEHEETFYSSAGEVLTWLKTKAPAYWRWAWLWITEAQLETPSDLLAGPSREWAIESLVSGYPIEQIVNIIEHAERVALDEIELPRLLSLRLLKERLLFGPEYEIQEWDLFQEVALTVSDDPYVRTLLETEIHKVPDELLPFIIRNSDDSNRANTTLSALESIERRNPHQSHYGAATVGSGRGIARAFAAVAASDTSVGPQRVEDIAKQFDNPVGTIEDYASWSMLASNFENIFAVGSRWSSDSLARDVLAALCIEGLNPGAKPNLKVLNHPAVRCLALVHGDAVKNCRVSTDLSRLFNRSEIFGPELTHEIRFTAYQFFFDALATGLMDDSDKGNPPLGISGEEAWLSRALLELERVAGAIAERWNQLGEWTTLKDFYGSFNLQPPMSHTFAGRRHFAGVRLALCDVAVDLCTIAKGLDANGFIDVDDIECVSTSPYWLDYFWLNAFVARRLPLHTPEAVDTFDNRVTKDLDAEITEFPERVSTIVKLSLFTSDHGLKSLARKDLSRAVGSLLGYGYHKDLFALEVLTSLNLLANQGDPDARQALLNLAGEFDAITEYTDGDETDNVRERYYQTIASQFPERVGACYAHLIRKGQWRDAQVLANAFSSTNEVGDSVGQALLETFIAPSEVRALTESAPSNPYRKAALRAIQLKIGRIPDLVPIRVTGHPDNGGSSHDDSSKSREGELSDAKPEEFPPGSLPGYLDAMRDVTPFDSRRTPVDEWLRYWAARGRAGEVLDELRDMALSSHFSMHVDNALDEAFEVALETQGRSKAYKWLVLAHIRNAGWERWYSSEEKAQVRMQQVATHYRGQWREFIRDTAVPRYAYGAERNGIAVGRSRLVYYLIEVGQQVLARRYTLEMACAFKEKVMDQPLEVPEWSN